MNRPRFISNRVFIGIMIFMIIFNLMDISSRNVLAAPSDAPQVGPADCLAPANEIVAENCLTGNPPSEWDVSGAGDDNIQGYATDISINQGGTVSFKVKTNASDYRLDIYRLGYYNGNGARKIATVQPSVTLPQTQPACLFNGTNNVNLVDCGNWSVSASWSVPANAVSGIYIAKLVREDGTTGASHITFIVRDDDGNSNLLFQTSDTTWQAYNGYGGYSLYSGPGHAHKVSYNRPFSTRTAPTEDFLFNAEYPMLRWLERNGYDVSYFTNVDADRYGSEILEHKVFLSVGHDEYWSVGQRTAVEAARDTGVHLAFFSANEIYWKTRWENSTDGSNTPYRTLVSYKEGALAGNINDHYDCGGNYACDPNPTQWTGLWRDGCGVAGHDGCKPENALSGTISWAGNTDTLSIPSEFGNLRFWRNTAIASLTPGTKATLTSGTLGYEWDWEQPQYEDNYPDGRILLSTTDSAGKTHHLSLYRASSGALVFGAGTVQWSWGLDSTHDRGNDPANPAMQQATVNLFADMGVQPGSLQTNLTAASASTDSTAPVSTITSPLNGATVNGTVTINGTATDTGGVVGAVEVSLDGGTTWKVATGRSIWSYSWTPAAYATVNVKTRAMDDSGNLETPSVGSSINVGPRTCPCSIWEGTGSPIVPNDTDGQPIEVGVKFRTAVNGYITGLRFYKGNLNTGTHTGHLWTSTGTQLAEVLFSGESASGWQEVTLSTPVAVSANTTYIASYYSSNNYFAWSNNYFSTATDNSPLRALANGEDGPNGVYRYGSGFPNQTYNASNYWVDVVFTNTVGPDNTAPIVNLVTPGNNATNVATSTNVSAVFNEPLNGATVGAATFELRDASNTLVPASVIYDNLTRTVMLDPNSVLAYSTTYTAKLIGGTGGIKDVAGNALAANYIWSFTIASPPPPPPDEGPGGPILVVSSAANPFSRYYAEILRTEGLNAFTVTDITNVNASLLNNYDVVILGEMSLTGTQVTVLTNWVTAGGNLIAMRPDKQLAGLLGLTEVAATYSNTYLLVNTASGPGKGIVNQSIQFHGTSDLYTLNGATALATLYLNSTTATIYPAVTLINVGSNGGQAAAFTFDLAKSVVYTRQGNPAWAGDERDGSAPIRANDQFYGAKTGDVQPDWIDRNKVAIPQADEQQRLLANLILETNLDKMPLPRFWYLPRGEKAVVVMTADDHAQSSNIPVRLDQYKSLSPVNCSVADWECVRSSVYIYPGSNLTAAQANAYNSDGFEIGVHVNTNCADFSQAELETYYASQLAEFATRFPALPLQDSERTHCIAWSNWAYQPKVMEQKGIRLDTNYYYWPPAWVGNLPGMFTGSGMPMRFADLNGSMFNVYQATTQMTDESGQTYPYTIDTLLDRALGTEGYYGVFTANMHSDNHPSSGSDAIIASAQSRGVPVISGRQLLTWLDGRNASSFANLAWSGITNTLNFSINANSGARGLQAMLPSQKSNLILQSLTRGGTPVAYTIETNKGITYARFAASSGAYVAQYSTNTTSDTTPPTVILVSPASGATGIALNTTITAKFSEAIDSLTLDGGGIELRETVANTVVATTVSYNAGTLIATLTPNVALASNTQYTAKLKGGSGGVSDVAGNPLASDYSWSFTTAANNCPCSIWGSTGTPASVPVTDGQPIEVGTKFRSDTAGYITSLRFYKGAGDTDTHVGHLWASTGGSPLATVTFTNETASGWQVMALSTPVQINANTTYIVSIYSSLLGNFAYSPGGLANTVNNPPLRALASGEDGPNGVYMYGGGFPSNGSNANYWVDVVFNTTIPNGTPPPSTFTPTNTAVAPTSTFTPTRTPTFTAIPPTFTFTPTRTPTFTPTSTTVPPTLTATSPVDIIFRDGFESGGLSSWTTSATDNGSLSVSVSAALTGTRGLSANINDNNSIYVQDDLPNAETRYRTRYYFDPNSITMSNGNAHYLLYGYSGTTTVVMRVEFRRSSTLYQVRASLVNNTTTWTNTNWFTISDAPHYMELDWRASSAAGANNGGLTLWIDGVQQANLTGVANDIRRIDRIQFGAVSGIDTGTRGVEYFDAFESRRSSYIGAEVSSSTPTSTVTFTALPSLTPTATLTKTPIVPTNTPTVTPNWTATSTFTNTPTLVVPTTATVTQTPTATLTKTPTITPNWTATSTFTNTPTIVVPATATVTQTPTATRTPTATITSTSVPGGFPTTGILDDFTRANGALGASWSGVTGGYAISSNRIDVGTGGDVYWAPAPFGLSQEAYVTLSTVDPAASEIDLLLKSQSNTSWTSGVIEVWYDPANARIQVWTFSPAQNWVQRGADIPVTFANGDRFGARATSTGQLEVYKNGTLLATRDVSAWTYNASGGYIGLWFVNAGNAFFDDFGGG